MSFSCNYPKCVAKITEGYKYCQCHSGWIRTNGLCYNCLAKKENPKFKLCSVCHQKDFECREMGKSTTCQYPYCLEQTTENHRYCQCHHVYVLKSGLCYNCCHKKEDPQFKLCLACHHADIRARNQDKRQEAIANGLCTNYWKCDKPAQRRGAMCVECYQEYLDKVHPTSERTMVSSLGPTRRAPLKIERPVTKTEVEIPVQEAPTQEAPTQEAPTPSKITPKIRVLTTKQ